MGADRVIAVDVGTPLRVLDGNASLVDVIGQLSGFLTTGSAQRELDSLGADDLVISPELTGKVATGDFDKAPEALRIGQLAADAAAPALRAFEQPPAVYAAWLAQRGRRTVPVTPTQVAFVEVVNDTGYADALLLSYLPLQVGAPLDAAAMQAGILRGYGMGTLASFSYEVRERDGQTGVVVTAHAKPNGPAYLEAGLSLSDDLQGNHESNLRAGLLFAPLSPYGAEARVVLQVGSERG